MPMSDDETQEPPNDGDATPVWRDREEDLPIGSGVPSNEVLLLPILQVLCDGLSRDIGALADAVADKLHLSAEVRGQRLPNGRTALANRIGWARTGLVKAGLAEQPARGQLVITPAGVDFCASHPDGEPISDDTLAKECPPFASWLADMGREAYLRSRGDDPNPTVWMVRAGEAGVYAPLFVEHSLAMLGWSETGSVEGLSPEDILAAVSRAFPDMRNAQRGQAANALARFAVEMQPGDLVVTPESRTRTILLGRVAGPYRYLDHALAGDYNHVRSVKWFARFSRDDLSYGAQNTLGSLLTLTKPSHEAELLGLAELHEGDEPPLPLSQTTAAAPRDPVRERVVIPLNATAPPRPTLGDFQTVPRRMMQLLDEVHSGQLALPDFQRTFVCLGAG